MKTLTPELETLLATGRYTPCDLFTLTLATGSILRKTSLPGLSVTWGGNLFAYDGIAISRGTITSKLHTDSLDVDNVDITVDFTPADSLQGLPVAAFVRNGGLDGARLLIQKGFCAVDSAGNTSSTVTGVMFLFEGRISEPRCGRMQVTAQVVADTERLKVNVPRNTINPYCMNTVFDSVCGLLESAYTHSNQTVTSATKTTITATLPGAAGFYSLGRVVFTGGQNAGATRTVKSWNGSVLSLAYPLDYTPQAGDTFNVVAGCDLSDGASGCAKFNNLPNRRAFPFVPAYEENL